MHALSPAHTRAYAWITNAPRIKNGHTRIYVEKNHIIFADVSRMNREYNAHRTRIRPKSKDLTVKTTYDPRIIHE